MHEIVSLENSNFLVSPRFCTLCQLVLSTDWFCAVLFLPPPLLLYTDLLMHFLPHNIENMLGFFLVLELEGLVLVLKSLGTNFSSRHARLIISGFALNRTHNGG